ncbi:MAG: hypothetical protein QF632_06340 [Candidatus Woesearchaeota archaeon]|jgi:hypothetical protein|nr:hypothetical protein [Candidatus Woesearchaeota archaeon]MDP7457419.1 hypothetical protein [Candidatus Woesearchaeota archaeon]
MKLFVKHKKASLQLSINAIVILILAITILGLGLGFIRSQFGSLQKQFDKVSSNIQNQIIEDIQKSGDLLSFTTLTFEDVKAGTQNDFFFGIKSTETTRDTCFYVEFVCENAIGTSCDAGARLTGVGSLSDAPTEAVPSGWNWFDTLQASRVEPGTVKVLKGILQALNAPSATYNGRVLVWKHYISTTAAAAPAQLEYLECYAEPVSEWPGIKKKQATAGTGKGVIQAGTNFHPRIKTATDATGRAVQLHDSKEFFIDLV